MWHWSKDIPKDMQQQRNRTTDTHSVLRKKASFKEITAKKKLLTMVSCSEGYAALRWSRKGEVFY